MEAGDDAPPQVLVGAGFEFPAQFQVGGALPAVEAPRHIPGPAVVGDARPAFAAPLIGVEDRVFAIVGQVADHRQVPAPGGIGQQFRRRHIPQAAQVGVGKKQVVVPGQCFRLPQKSVEPLHRTVGPGQGLLFDAPHIGPVRIGKVRRVGKDKEGAFAVRQKMFLEIGVEVMPEHPVGAGAQIQHRHARRSVHVRSLLFRTMRAAYSRR